MAFSITQGHALSVTCWCSAPAGCEGVDLSDSAASQGGGADCIARRQHAAQCPSVIAPHSPHLRAPPACAASVNSATPDQAGSAAADVLETNLEPSISPSCTLCILTGRKLKRGEDFRDATWKAFGWDSTDKKQISLAVGSCLLVLGLDEYEVSRFADGLYKSV